MEFQGGHVKETQRTCKRMRRVHWQEPLPKHNKSSSVPIADGRKTKGSSGTGFMASVFSACKKVEVSEMKSVNGKTVDSFQRKNIRPPRPRRPGGEKIERDDK
ncbi:hypothetical protein SUGI_0466280 [Cryptomeria japonica]|nr:hypothetical protein SUGI_0466280 [Cryptomeria japonica]